MFKEKVEMGLALKLTLDLSAVSSVLTIVANIHLGRSFKYRNLSNNLI